MTLLALLVDVSAYGMKTYTPQEPPPICKAKTRSGAPCRMKPGTGGWCFTHDPERGADRTAARRRGGLRRAGLLARAVLSADEAGAGDLNTPDEVRGLLSATIRHAQTGRLDCRIAATVGTLAGVLLRAVEQGELERRLAEIEAALVRMGRGDA